MWLAESVLAGGGECGRLMRSFDWKSSPLGEPQFWSPELHTVVSIAFGSKQPMLIVWGPEQITLYNDGYAAMCGQRHPAALGKPFRDLWFDIWDQVDPIITAAYNGISTSMDDIEFTMHRNGYPEETHFSFSYTPVRSSTGAVLGMFCACNEITNEVISRRERERERERLRSIFEIALGAVAILTGPEHVFAFANADYELLIGHRDVVGKPIATALPEVIEQGFKTLLDKVYETGVPHIGKGVPVELQRTPNAPRESRLVDFLFHPLRDDRGRIDGIFVQALDVTEQHVLHRELAHRLKNQLSLVQAIVNQTLRSSTDLTQAKTVLGERIAVLGRAHDTIIAGQASGSSVDDVVKSALAWQLDARESRISISGPRVAIASRPALSLALVLHELLTNAVKYGALSNDEGRISIEWKTERADGILRFGMTWREEGGPAVSEPSRPGSGTRLIRAGLAGTHDCTVELAYAATGLTCAISVGLSGLQTEQ